MTITIDQATKNAKIVYDRLLKQGRPEADARRDAERWVLGNNGVTVTLPAPAGQLDDTLMNLRDMVRRSQQQYAPQRASQPRASMGLCPTCFQPWPFTGRCESCQRDSWMADRKNMNRSNGARKAAAKRKVNKAHKAYMDMMWRFQSDDPFVNGAMVDSALRLFDAANEEYSRVCYAAAGGVFA